VRNIHRDERGLSEIVGTLFLVLIVVAAATTFSIFVATYQKQLQSEQSFNQQRGLEDLQVIHLAPLACTTGCSPGGNWAILNFTLVSLYVGTSVVTGISIDGQQVANYTVTGVNETTDLPGSWSQGFSQDLYVAAHAQLQVQISLQPGAGNTSLLDGAYSLALSQYIQITLLTAYDNVFTTTFTPPTAIAVVGQLETLNNGSYDPIPLLDGSHSIAPVNTTLISWEWVVTDELTNASRIFIGEMASDPYVNASTTYVAELTVVDSNGLTNSTSTEFVE
jgi:flagellin-like protein